MRRISGEKRKSNIAIFCTTMTHSVDLFLRCKYLSRNRLGCRKCNLVVSPLLHTVNIFISSEAPLPEKLRNSFPCLCKQSALVQNEA